MKPAEMVKAAIEAGKGTSAEGIPWIKEKYNVDMKGQVFGRMLAFLKEKPPQKRTKPKRGSYKKKEPHAPQKANWEVSRQKYIQKKIDLAKTIKELLKNHLPTEIEEMVSIVAATS